MKFKKNIITKIICTVIILVINIIVFTGAAKAFKSG
ncbi:hypothetical protein CLRAG_08690 [Clostridium ragsdalei P11]|uniref:Uncharacterized protein n=1 Tax=Clostridium ragsdalei P11 TaxID=1353534 RepID=A0A1A6AZJ7_9CLOT|nr:hypothetical protein CLRAG_08690 [Clostridium ragsdalei P11]